MSELKFPVIVELLLETSFLCSIELSELSATISDIRYSYTSREQLNFIMKFGITESQNF